MICELCSCSFDGRKSRFVIRRVRIIGPPSLTHFCSKKCLERSQTRWIPLRCRNCAHRFPGKVRRRDAKRHRKPFCSPGCRAVFPLRMKNSTNPTVLHRRKRDPYWKRMAAEARWRDQYICQVCGARQTARRKLSVDHIVSLKLSGEHKLENLITVCEFPCHWRKTDRIEKWLLWGNVPLFLTELRKAGWPMGRVKAALRLYNLPVHKFHWPRLDQWGW